MAPQRRWFAPYRLRILLRAAFLLLALATLGLAVSVLQQEKQLSYTSYQASFRKTGEQISATLRHPAGQLALLNPPLAGAAAPGLRPLLLPFPALDFDDQQKVQQAVAMSGCMRQFGPSASLCAAVGNNPWAGGFIYVAGSVDLARLVSHRSGDEVLNQSHRVRIKVSLRGRTYQWVAPFEEEPRQPGGPYAPLRGRLTGFNAADEGRKHTRPVKDFRGWMWQNAQCNAPAAGATPATCPRNAFFSVRLPVSVLQEDLFGDDSARRVWPPADLDQIRVSVVLLAPGENAVVLDSDQTGAASGFSLADLAPMLLPGETLRIDKAGSAGAATTPALVKLAGASGTEDASQHFLTALIRRLPVDTYDTPLTATHRIATPLGSYDVVLAGDVRSVSQSLGVVASRMAWFVGAMLLALMLAWLVIEIGIISRIKELIERADSVARTVKERGDASQPDLSDLRGEDELGVLATCLHDLLRRVREDVEREAIRAEQERDMWHAVGHEIMSPLQSLIALHGTEGGDGNQSARYVLRMQQAIRVLYGRASPSEAFQSTVLQVTEVDLTAFLCNVAANAPCAGITDVVFHGARQAVLVRADEYSLEDVVTHVLVNAQRYRLPGTSIDITLDTSETSAGVTIANRGPTIAADVIGTIFEYGVSDQEEAGAHGNRGQGLFVARTYMAKMGGTIVARNLDDGVAFVLTLQRGAV
ncbi:sensor histidine kinase [Massilia antarctica]|uniref:sensor histidine kinase n=1 Tax=Massilia antarctica TaxID=2765360 RepID=UPI0006BB8A4E|nr:sensor histidine kinase [Massilia sp. H27-R4]MCY0916478.1 sensor histidine kinase [Massilia sp. H27-R4]CUI07202.1 Heavy metal sensor histidine kinase [Janthinobacterium sp. CG23_2]CUU30988.1 Heavy metal sensor histidine kinase [Janthinobacterium sp. CG23_2]